MPPQLVPSSLSLFKTNQTLKCDYTRQPTFHGFDSINLNLAALTFRMRINVY